MIKKLLLATVALASFSLTLVGCDDETHADPAIVDSMNKQREAQARGMAGQKGATPGTPGAPTTNPYGNPPAGAPPATK